MANVLYGDSADHVPSADLSSATVTFYKLGSTDQVTTSYQYTGFPMMPGPVVTLGQTTLVPDVDYRLEFYDNVDLGTATCKVIGKGSYVGELTATFTITRTIEDATVVVYPLSYDYTGSPIVPTSVTVMYYDGSNLVEGVDYTVSYSSSTNVGDALVTITGIGKFVGTKTSPYFITRKDLNTATLTLPQEYDTYKTYDGTAFTPTPTAYMGQTLLVVDQDYVVSYLNNTNPGQATVVISGRGNYKGDKTVSFVIKGDLSSAYPRTVWAITSKSFTFANSAVTPQVSVYFSDLTDQLSTSSDIDIAFTNNVNAATYDSAIPPTMTVTAKSGSFYFGSFTETFTIVPKSLSGAYIEFPQTTYPYLGNPLTPVPVVSVVFGDDYHQLANVTDFSLSYLNNNRVGLATTTVTGVGNYTGTATGSFTIRAASLSDAEVTLAEHSFTYDGTQKCPAVESVVLYGVTLTVNVDYSVTYADNINAGSNTARVIIAAAEGNRYSGIDLGEKVVRFSIAQRDISAATLTVPGSPFGYTGQEICPTVVVTDSAVSASNLVLGTDYTVSYTGNVNANTWPDSQNVATAIATGKGNYTGTVSTTFGISPQDFSGATITLPYSKYLFTGSAIEPAGMLVTLDSGTGSGIISIPPTDYTVTYSGNTQIGTATITVVGRNNCSGTITTTFPIVERNMSNVIVAFENDITRYVYNGTSVTPNYSVDGGSFMLVKGRDFTEEWINNDRTGNTACLKLTAIGSSLSDGHGAMSGFTFAYFQITPMSISGKVNLTFDSVAKSSAVQAYAYRCQYDSLTGNNGASELCPEGYIYVRVGGVAKPSVTASLKDVSNGGVTFVEGTDFDVEYNDNDKIGVATVRIVSKSGVGLPNRYTGSVSFDFVIRDEFSTVTCSPIPPIPYSASLSSLYVSLMAAEYRNGSTSIVPASTGDRNTFLLVGDDEEVQSATYGYRMTYGRAMYRISSNMNVGTHQVVLYPYMAVDAVYRGSGQDDEDEEYRGLALYLPKSIGSGILFKYVSGFTGWKFNRDFAGQKIIDVTVSPVDINSLSQNEDTSPLIKGTPFEIMSVQDPVCPTVILRGSQASDFSHSYHNNTRPGKASVTLTSALVPGNLYGSRTEYFTIYLSESLVSIGVTKQSFTGSQICPPPSIDFDDETISEGVDYNVSFGTNHDVGYGHTSVYGRLFANGASKSFEIVRGVLNSAEKYVVHSMDSSGNQVDTIVTGENPHVTIDIDSLCFVSDGTTEHEPVVSVKYDGVELVRWTDYYLYYTNTKDAGIGYVVIVGMGGFDGEIKKTVRILPSTFPNSTVLSEYYHDDPDNPGVSDPSHPYVTVHGVEDKAYTGSAVEQNPVVRFAGTVLTKDVDYSLTYSDNVQISEGQSVATVTITGIGSYSGSVSRTFRIYGDLSGATVTAAVGGSVLGQSVQYTGSHIEPTPTVTFGSTVLTSSDYDVKYFTNRYPGVAKVRVVGKGKYRGHKDLEFNIVASLDAARQDGSPYLTVSKVSDVEYGSQSPQNPGVAVYFDDKVLVEGTDYVKSYSESSLPAVVNATFTGSGSFYSGTKTVNGLFTRYCSVDSQKKVEDSYVKYLSVSIPGGTHTGSPVTPAVTVSFDPDPANDSDSAVTVDPSLYSVSYSNNTNVGTAYAMVTFVNPYRGTKVTTFQISS